MSEIDFDKISLVQLLASDGHIIVPQYQRSYSWKEENFAELWEDILSVILDQSRDHFTGTLIFCKPSNPLLLNDSTDIVDGQQRLITLSILLRVMYDNLDSNSALSAYIYDCIRRGRYEDRKYYKLTLGENDRDFFVNFIQHEDRPFQSRRGKNKSHKLIVKAYHYFDKEIKSLIKRRSNNTEDTLNELFTKMQQKLIAVRIKVASEVDAYTIFETINSKKASLTVSDLLKNFIFSSAHKLGNSELEEARQNWNLMVDDLGHDIEISYYVRHHWISAYERSRDKDLYRKIKDRFRGDDLKVLDFSKMLASEAKLYNLIFYPLEESLNKDICNLIVDINSLRVRQCYPLILSSFVASVQHTDLDHLLKKILAVSLRRGIVDKNPNEVENYYADIAKKLRDNAISVKSILEGLNKFNPRDKEIKNYLEENPISESLAKFILVKYENSKSTGEKHTSRPTLEHILPRKPENLSSWGLTEADHGSYFRRLGNLTLVGKKFNSIMSNKAYSLKRSELLKSDIKIASEIGKNHKQWGMNEINKRTLQVLNFVFEKWPQQ